MGAMSAYGISYLTGSPWLGVLVAGASAMVLGALHTPPACSRPRVSDIAVGIALLVFGTGPARSISGNRSFSRTTGLPAIELSRSGSASRSQVRPSLQVNALCRRPGAGTAAAVGRCITPLGAPGASCWRQRRRGSVPGLSSRSDWLDQHRGRRLSRRGVGWGVSLPVFSGELEWKVCRAGKA